ncbi:MAG: SBBP repeat-containing protein [Anaerolineales bacterium]|nr:SBBP repeat-containing protein [Anaerolineales bacterium]
MGGTAYDQGNDIAVDSNNNIYMTGFFRNTVDFDSAQAQLT